MNEYNLDKIVRRCCVCKTPEELIDNPIYSDGVLSKKCYEIMISELSAETKSKMRTKESYLSMPDTCDFYK